MELYFPSNMHEFILVRGQPLHIKAWENDWAAQYFPYEMKNTDLLSGKKEGVKPGIVAVQCNLREIKLYEMVFPKPCRDQVLKTLYGTNAQINSLNTFTGGLKTSVLRRVLTAKKIMPFDEDAQNRIIRTHGVSVYPIGEKEDKETDAGEYL